MEICYFLQFLFFVDVLCSFLPKSLKSLGASCTLGHHILPYCRTRRASVLIMVTWCRTGGVGWTGLTCSNWLRIRGQYHYGWGSPYRRRPWHPHHALYRLGPMAAFIYGFHLKLSGGERSRLPLRLWIFPVLLGDFRNFMIVYFPEFFSRNWSGKNWKDLCLKLAHQVYTRVHAYIVIG